MKEIKNECIKCGFSKEDGWKSWCTHCNGNTNTVPKLSKPDGVIKDGNYYSKQKDGEFYSENSLSNLSSSHQ